MDRTNLRVVFERLEIRQMLAAAAGEVFAKHPLAIHVGAQPEYWQTVDAPLNWQQHTPSRTLLQTIDNRLHRWSEYDAPEGTFIVTQSPSAMALSAQEAAGLLSASSAWIDTAVFPEEAVSSPRPRTEPAGQTPAVSGDGDDEAGPLVTATSTATSPSQDLPPDPRGTSPIEDVIGTDDRIRVTGTTTFPFNTVGYVSNTYPGGGSFRGTAFLITPFVALTNAHNIYDSDTATYINQIDFTPGQRQDSAGGTVTEPYGQLDASGWQTNSGFINAGPGYNDTHIQFDYAALFFDRSWQTRGIGTFMPLAFDITPGAVNTAGYPRVVQGESNSLGQWRAFGTYSSVDGRILSYDNDSTGGNSGGPVWEFFSSTNTRRVVAVHSYGGSSDNGGPRLVSQNQNLINSWMTHAPTIAADRFEGNDSIAGATDLGVVGSRIENNLTIHAGGNDDYYRFVPRFSGNTRVEALFSDLDGDVDVQVLNAAGSVIASSTGVVDNEIINVSLTGGQTYYVRVYGFSGATNPEYDLRVTGPSAYVDRFEPNNSLGAPTSFGTATAVNEAGLTVHNSSDGDFYRITTVGAGTLSMNLSFRHLAGDVDMQLYNSAGTVVASSTGVVDTESISLPVLAGQTYTLNVYGYLGAINEYALSMTAPAAAAGPSVTGSDFLFQTAQQVYIDFTADISSSLAANDLQLTRAGGGTATPSSVSWNPTGRRATWTLTNLLSDGNWTATLPAGSVTGGGGPLATPHTHSFFVLAGDANRNRTVNIDDFGLLGGNFNQPGTFGTGDFNYSGSVNIDDFGLLAARFNMSIPPAAGARPDALPPLPGQKPGVFADRELIAELN